jgi:hypothetical protein
MAALLGFSIWHPIQRRVPELACRLIAGFKKKVSSLSVCLAVIPTLSAGTQLGPKRYHTVSFWGGVEGNHSSVYFLATRDELLPFRIAPIIPARKPYSALF